MSFKKAFESAEQTLARMGYEMSNKVELVKNEEIYKFGGSAKTQIKRRAIIGTDKFIAVCMDKVTGMKASYATYVTKADLTGICFGYVYADQDSQYIEYING